MEAFFRKAPCKFWTIAAILKTSTPTPSVQSAVTQLFQTDHKKLTKTRKTKKSKTKTHSFEGRITEHNNVPLASNRFKLLVVQSFRLPIFILVQALQNNILHQLFRAGIKTRKKCYSCKMFCVTTQELSIFSVGVPSSGQCQMRIYLCSA